MPLSNTVLTARINRFNELKTQQAALVEAAETADRVMTEDENEAFTAAQTERDGLAVRIEKLKSVLTAELTEPLTATVDGAGGGEIKVKAPNFVADPLKGFRNGGHFFHDVYKASKAGRVEDPRLRFLQTDHEGNAIFARSVDEFGNPTGITAGSDEQSTFADPYGGFFIPEGIIQGPLQLTPEADPVASLVTQIPMATSTVKLNARVDKNHNNSVSGGFRVYRRAEADTSSSSRTAYEQITLTADTLFGVAYATEELLRDSPVSFAAIIDAGFRDEMPNKEMDERIRGTGVGEFTGILNAACKITVTAESPQTADTIVTENIINMRSRAYNYQNCIWMYNHDCLPQLMTLVLTVGTSGVLMWQMDAISDRPATFFGRPAIANGHLPTLGDAGCLVLVDWSQYLEGTYQPFESAESAHVRFLQNERTFRVTKRNAAAPWWRSALTPQVSTTTLGPIIELGEVA